MAPHPPHKQAIESHILSERTQKYRRAVFGLAIVLIALHMLSDKINADNMSFFGVTFKDGHGKDILVSALWIALVFNAVMFLKDAWYELRAWGMNVGTVINGIGYPNLRMLFGGLHKCLPGPFKWIVEPKNRENSGHALMWTFEKNTTTQASWMGKIGSEKGSKSTVVHKFDLPDFKMLRTKLRDFIWIEIGLPLLAVLLALFPGMLFWLHHLIC